MGHTRTQNKSKRGHRHTINQRALKTSIFLFSQPIYYKKRAKIGGRN